MKAIFEREKYIQGKKEEKELYDRLERIEQELITIAKKKAFNLLQPNAHDEAQLNLTQKQLRDESKTVFKKIQKSNLSKYRIEFLKTRFNDLL